jgi:hypothetical protein
VQLNQLNDHFAKFLSSGHSVPDSHFLRMWFHASPQNLRPIHPVFIVVVDPRYKAQYCEIARLG